MKSNFKSIILPLIGLVIVLIVIVVNIFALLRTVEKKALIYSGAVRNFVNMDATILRPEKLIYANDNGKFSPSVSEGERIAKGERIALLYNSTSKKLLENANKAENELMVAIEETLDSNAYDSQDIKKINDAIDMKVNGIIDAERTGDFNSALSYERDIRFYTKEKINLIVKKLPKGDYIRQLKVNADYAKNAFDESAGSVASPYAGTISFEIDGNEKALSKYYKSNISLTQLEKVQIQHKANKIVKGEAFAKIVTGFEQKLAVVTDENTAMDFKVGSLREIHVNDVSVVSDAYVQYKSTPQNGKVVLVFLMDRGVTELSGLRKVNIDVAKEATTMDGLKVPVKSLFDFSESTDKDGVKYQNAKIMIVRAHIVTAKEVKIVIQDGKDAIIESVDGDKKPIVLYDEYVINPNNVREGDIVN